MPNDVKAIVSALSLIVAAILAYWSKSPVRPDFATFIMVTAVFMVVAMWIFPEAGVKRGDVKRVKCGSIHALNSHKWLRVHPTHS